MTNVRCAAWGTWTKIESRGMPGLVPCHTGLPRIRLEKCTRVAETSNSRSLLQQAAVLVSRFAGVPALLVLAVLAALFPLVLFPACGTSDFVPLDLHFSYNPELVSEYLAELGAEERRSYRCMLLIPDMVFPVVYAAALSVLLMLVLCRHVSPARGYLCLFPFLVVIADWGENLFLAAVVAAYPESLDGVIRVASLFTALKWVLLALTLLVLLSVLLVRLAEFARAG
jgi:hypothetical protein